MNNENNSYINKRISREGDRLCGTTGVDFSSPVTRINHKTIVQKHKRA